MRKLVAAAMFSGDNHAQKWHSIRRAAPVLAASGLALMAVLAYAGALRPSVAACGLVAGFAILCSYVCLFAGNHTLYLLAGTAIGLAGVVAVLSSERMSLWLLLLNGGAAAFVTVGLGSVAITKYFGRWK
jgi:hypothetical protein